MIIIKGKKYDEAVRKVVPTNGELYQWDLVPAIGKELGIRAPLSRPLFRARLALHVRWLEKSGKVMPEYKTETLVEHVINYFTYRSAALGRST